MTIPGVNLTPALPEAKLPNVAHRNMRANRIVLLMADHARWRLLPGIAGLGQAKAEVVELAHIERVKGLRAGVDKSGRNVSEVVVHAIATGE